MTKLITALVAAIFALGVVSPVAFAADTKDETKKEQKAKKKKSSKKKDEGEQKK